MNKNELVRQISIDSNLNQEEATRALNAVVDTITKALQQGKTISLRDFGKFESVVKSARKGRNFQTGECIDVPEKTVVRCKLSQSILNK